MKKNNIIEKIKSWWYNFFHKSQLLNESTLVLENNTIDNVSKTNMFDVYREKSQRNSYLLQLQKKFESKIILESELTEKDKIDLETLYIEQISNLKRNIKAVENKINKLN